MKRIIRAAFAAILMCPLVGCGEQKSSEEQAVADSDSVEALPASADSLPVEEEQAPPPAADGLFDDFIYNFMRNRSFQLSRITFPLTYTVDGRDSVIRRSDWHYDRLYADRDVYTMIFDDRRSVNLEKDTTLRKVMVEWIDLPRSRVKQYHFHKRQGRWLLTSLSNQLFSDSEDHGFYEFYSRFATDEAYQQAHVADPLLFTTYDYDNFQEIDGVLAPEQWPDFRPELPSHVITNVVYGGGKAHGDYRAMVISTPSAGMSCTLEFRRRDGEWMLTSMKN